MIKRISPQQLEDGMVTAEPVTTPSGQILAPVGVTLTKQLINKIKLYNISFVTVAIPTSVVPPTAITTPICGLC